MRCAPVRIIGTAPSCERRYHQRRTELAHRPKDIVLLPDTGELSLVRFDVNQQPLRLTSEMSAALRGLSSGPQFYYVIRCG
jgi:hypothetical protein